jgi:hypothetical protein
MGGVYVKAGVSESITLRVRGGTIILDEHRVGESSPSTRITASYISRDGFTFSIHSKTLLHSIAKVFGMQDVEVGDSEFDNKFIIRGNNIIKLQSLFGRESIREKLLSIHETRWLFLEVTQAENPGVSPLLGDRSQIVWSHAGLVGSIDLLRSIFELFAEILSQLCEMGAATEED